MKLRALGPLHAVRRPRAAVLLEMARCGRMPVACDIHGDATPVCISKVAIQSRTNVVSAWSGERATGAEILLYIADEQRRFAIRCHWADLRNHRSRTT